MSDDLVKRLMHRSHPLHIEAAKRIQSQAARIERLEAGFRAVEKLTRGMPGEFKALNKHAQAMLEKEEGK